MEILKVVLTSVLSAATLFVIAKIIGHKQISQLNFFDYITGITIGSIAAELATELENPIQPLVAMIMYGIITVVLNVIATRVPGLRKYINGTPTIIMNDGKIYRKNLKKAKIDLSEFMVLCRQEGYFNLSDIKTAVFEYNGRVTILPVSNKKPVTPENMNISVEQEHITAELVMDGKILKENLQRMNIDSEWLRTQLKVKGYKDIKNVFLCLCDENKNLTVYSGE